MTARIGHNQDGPDWDNWWAEKFKQHRILYKAWYFYLWRAYERLLSYIDLSPESRVMELGCGSGYIPLHIAKKYGCSVTLVDTSKSAIAQTTKLFNDHNVSAHFVHSDLFNLSLTQEFDLVYSEGLIEHFYPRDIQRVLLVHKNAVRQGGYVITFAPINSLWYQLTTWIMKATGNWYFGYEVPISLHQHVGLYEEVGLKVIGNTGVSLREIGLLGEKL